MEDDQSMQGSQFVGISYVDRLAIQFRAFKAWHDFSLYNEDSLFRIAQYASVQAAAAHESSLPSASAPPGTDASAQEPETIPGHAQALRPQMPAPASPAREVQVDLAKHFACMASDTAMLLPPASLAGGQPGRPSQATPGSASRGQIVEEHRLHDPDSGASEASCGDGYKHISATLNNFITHTNKKFILFT